MSHLLRAAVAATILSATGAVATGQTLALRDAVREALTANPAIAAAGARRDAALAGQSEARAGWFPRLDLSESATRGNNPVFVFGSLLEQGAFAQRHFDPGFLNAPPALTNYRSAVTLRMPLFDRFGTSTSVRRSALVVERADRSVDEARQNLRSEVVARYYGVVLAAEKVAVAREAMTAARADAKAARDRFDHGLLVESDALAADVHAASFQQRVIAAEGDLAIARAALAMLLQRPRSEALVPAGSLPDGPTEEPELEAAVGRALSGRVPVKAAASSVSDARLALSAERATALPRVDAFGTFGASSSSFGHGNSDFIGGVAVTVELFDRGRSARVAAARAAVAGARAADLQIRDAVTMEVITAWHRLHAARESAAVTGASVEQADSAARIVRDRYEHGLTTITEQLRAQTALTSARFDLLAARYDALIAQIELLRATGDLDDVPPFL